MIASLTEGAVYEFVAIVTALTRHAQLLMLTVDERPTIG